MIDWVETACWMMLDTIGLQGHSPALPDFPAELHELGIVHHDIGPDGNGVAYDRYMESRGELQRWRKIVDDSDYRSLLRLQQVDPSASNVAFTAMLSHRLGRLNRYIEGIVPPPTRDNGVRNKGATARAIVSGILDRLVDTLTDIHDSYKALQGRYESAAVGFNFLHPHYPKPMKPA
ncbi:hypothetical protein IU427_26490 [Nocardia beijingensis]|uniref:hypothetical protein n=1 Tax=Nocardia beijingensis TaxID=95162 RepID=UPI0018931808|nr:hypothetical protein [Nocardia beijingensis]MBF6468685.1 hypothetical protein [Nocardia beijingensis]